MNKKETALIKKLCLNLCDYLSKAKVKIQERIEDEALYLEIATQEPGILIGNRGEILQSLQLILNLMVYKKLKVWHRIVVNVNDWLQKRDEELKRLALNTAQKVKFSGNIQALANLTSAERRIIHLVLKDNPDVATESEGDGKDRHLLVKPKQIV